VNLQDAIVRQINDCLSQAEEVLAARKPGETVQYYPAMEAVTRSAAVFDRVVPDSAYTRQLAESRRESMSSAESVLEITASLLRGLLKDIAGGFLVSAEELIHASTFGDFLEMAAHLLDDGGYKDAAAVVAGSTLEAHLRALAAKHGIPTDRPTQNGPAPKKAEALNADLAGAGAYGKGDQKNVTAWLDLRNNAAHGHYTRYAPEQVALLIQSVRDFVTRVPA
jgi:hypothetical protein